MQLSLSQYIILNACSACSPEFYFLFWAVSNKGAEFRPDGPPSCTGKDVSEDISSLLRAGFLEAEYEGSELDLSVYDGYSSTSHSEHLEQYGSLPRFTITQQGLEEMKRPEYHRYDEELGWPIA